MDPLKELEVNAGLGVSYDRNGNTFWGLNYISQAVSSKKPIVFVSSRFSATTYRIYCSKQIIRWDPALISFIELPQLIEDSFHVDFEKIIQSIKETITLKEASFIVFDDFSIFERLGAASADVVLAAFELYAVLPQDGLFFAQFSSETKAHQLLSNKADFNMSFDNIGSGFGKNVTGTLSIRMRSNNIIDTEKVLLYYTGDRGTKFFYPGSVPFQL